MPPDVETKVGTSRVGKRGAAKSHRSGRGFAAPGIGEHAAMGAAWYATREFNPTRSVTNHTNWTYRDTRGRHGDEKIID